MNDTIYRRDAIQALVDTEEIKGFAYRILEDRLMEIPSADRPQEWIPTSVRLPRARESVLLAVNHKYGDWIGEGCYWETTDNHIIWKGYRWNATYWDDEIIAWMPLPKPWKGADDE